MPSLPERRLEGLCLRSHPLGEADRLLTLLTREEGLLRVVAAGARRPRSSLAAAAPLVLLEVQVARGRSLDRLRVTGNIDAPAEKSRRIERQQDRPLEPRVEVGGLVEGPVDHDLSQVVGEGPPEGPLGEGRGEAADLLGPIARVSLHPGQLLDMVEDHVGDLDAGGVRGGEPLL